jgi:transposase InsO family protein
MLITILRSLLSGFQTRRALVLENLALRHQLQVRNRGGRRPQLKNQDRLLWVLLSRFWSDWRRHLLIVRPDTVIRWHRAGFRSYWRWKSKRRRKGRPRLTLEERELIRRLARENPLWGAPHIHAELLKLGIEIGESTVSKYMKHRRPPSQGWKTFLVNHASEIASVDFFTATTATMKALYVFVVLSHDRRKILGYEITDAPTGEWAAEQVIEALDIERPSTILLRDQDRKFGDDFNEAMDGAGIKQILSAYRCPWQNGYVERVIGTIRRECLDHVIIIGGGHLRRVLDEYVAYYNRSRTHLGLEKDCPVSRPVESRDVGEIVAMPILGGLHHRYKRRAA